MLNAILVQGRLHVSLSLYLINSTEYKVHLLECLSFGFLEEDSHEYTHASAEGSEHDECFPAHGVDGTRSDFGDDEIEEPLSGGSEPNTI